MPYWCWNLANRLLAPFGRELVQRGLWNEEQGLWVPQGWRIDHLDRP